MKHANPWALRGIIEKLHEAADRGLWAEPDPELMAAMQQVYLDVEGDLEDVPPDEARPGRAPRAAYSFLTERHLATLTTAATDGRRTSCRWASPTIRPPRSARVITSPATRSRPATRRVRSGRGALPGGRCALAHPVAVRSGWTPMPEAVADAVAPIRRALPAAAR